MARRNPRLLKLKSVANTLYRTARLYHSNRSLRAWGVLLSDLCRTAFSRSVPTFMTVAPTYRCQCRCPHCYSNAPDRDKSGELDTDELKSVIDQGKRLGVLEILFSAGEPLLRDDIVELVRHAHGAGLLTRMNTNGMLLNRELVARLKGAGLTQCGVSIDDVDPEVHDRLRGVAGAHAKAVEGIRNLHEVGIRCQIQTYAARRLIPDGLEKIIALGRELRVLAVYIFFPVAVGRWDCAYDQVLTEEEKARVRELHDLTFVHLELPTPRTLCCLLTKSILYVSPQGDVTPCPFVPYVLGNIKDHPLGELWRRHCAELGLEHRGGCPMNDVESRAALQRHVESVASRLASLQE